MRGLSKLPVVFIDHDYDAPAPTRIDPPEEAHGPQTMGEALVHLSNMALRNEDVEELRKGGNAVASPTKT